MEKTVKEGFFVDEPNDFKKSSGFVADTTDDQSDVLEEVSVEDPKDIKYSEIEEKMNRREIHKVVEILKQLQQV